MDRSGVATRGLSPLAERKRVGCWRFVYGLPSPVRVHLAASHQLQLFAGQFLVVVIVINLPS